MLIRHTLRYMPAQVLAPAAQLVSMILWTHWLGPAEMATYTLVTVAQEMAFVFTLGWFSVYALRYLPSDGDRHATERYLSTENVVVLTSVFGSLIVAAVVLATLPRDGATALHVLVVALFFASRGFNAHYAERARAQQAFLAYTLLQAVGPVGGCALGLLAVDRIAADAWVLLGAYAAAQLSGTLLALPLLGLRRRLVRPDTAMLRAAAAFGLPIVGLGLLGWIAENYIRYLVQWQSGAVALGMMSVGWSLGRRCAGVASMLVTTAGFPLAARLLNEGRRAEALAQLRTNAALMLAVLAPVTAGMALLAPALASLTVAPMYRDITAQLLGLSVLGGAVRNLHAHVTDQLMVLERRIAMVVRVDLIEIVACVLASLAGLALYGLHGAVIGQAAGSALTLAVSAFWARRHLGFEWPVVSSAKIALACAALALALRWFGTCESWSALVGATVVGGLAYAAASAALFARQCRQMLATRREAKTRRPHQRSERAGSECR